MSNNINATAANKSETSLDNLRQRVNVFLKKQLELHQKNIKTCDHASNEQQLHNAMQYSLLDNGGNRWRPLLVYCTTQALKMPLAAADTAAAAIECIHAYSLAHDDLPAMDDDDFRRGKPSCHLAFDEATAILAGDSLSNMAFEILSQAHPTDEKNLQPQQQLDLIKVLTKAAGASGMAYGQALDLAASKNGQQQLQQKNHQQKIQLIENIHHYKTGCLFAAAMEMAAIISGVNIAAKLQDFHQLGLAIGACYQLQDDIEDAKQDEKGINLASATDSSVTAKKLTQHQHNIQKLLQKLIPAPEKKHLTRLLCFMLDF